MELSKRKIKKKSYKLTYEKIKNILGFEIDHSFLSYKKRIERLWL